MTTISAREFNRDVSAAKRAAAEGPVVITDRGAEAFVLLSIEEYRRLRADSQDIVQRHAGRRVITHVACGNQRDPRLLRKVEQTVKP